MNRPSALRLLPAFLFDDRQPAWRYVLLAWPLCFLPTLLLGWLARRLLPGTAVPDLGGNAVVAWIGVVLISPVVETLLLAGLVSLLNRLFGTTAAILLSAALWGAAHSLMAPAWGLVVWWPFLLFATAFLTWRRQGDGRAITVVTAMHVLQNLTAMTAATLG